MAPPSITAQLIYSILQYLDLINLKETARTLESESGFFFNLRYFEELLINGALDEADQYFAGFSTPHDNMFSTRIVFEIRKQKFLEALDKRQRAKALSIIMEELKTFQRYNDNLIPVATHLLTLDNFRTYHSLREYEDTETARKTMMKVIKICVEANPLLHAKMQPPLFNNNNTVINNAGPPPILAPLSVSPSLNLALSLSSGFF